MLTGSYQLGLSDILDQNLSCYEYFHSLPKALQDEIRRQDLGSFEEIQQYVQQNSSRDVPPVLSDMIDMPGESRV